MHCTLVHSLYFLKAGVLLNTIETLQIHNVTLNGDHLTNGILPLVNTIMQQERYIPPFLQFDKARDERGREESYPNPQYFYFSWVKKKGLMVQKYKAWPRLAYILDMTLKLWP